MSNYTQASDLVKWADNMGETPSPSALIFSNLAIADAIMELVDLLQPPRFIRYEGAKPAAGPLPQLLIEHEADRTLVSVVGQEVVTVASP